ncbi:MAG: tetratricopeptide repeat protein, partial [Bacteroidota bacterium]
MKKKLYIFFLLFYPLFSFSQQSKIDSLLSVLKTVKEDTIKANILNELSKQLWQRGNYDTALIYAENAKKLAEKINFKKGSVSAYNNIGVVNLYIGNFPKALENFFPALKIAEEIGDKNKMSSVLSNIGVIYQKQGDPSEALKNNFAALKIRETIGDKQGIATSYNNIGFIYQEQGNLQKALETHFSSLKIFEEIGDKNGIASSYANIGIIYYEQGKYPEGIKNYFAALKIYEEIEDKEAVASMYINIGENYNEQKKFNEARKYLDKGLTLSKEIAHKEWIGNAYSGLTYLDSAQGDWESAFKHYRIFVAYRDSLINEENTKKTVQTAMQYEFDKKESLAKADQDKKDAVTAGEKQRQEVIIYSVSAGLFLVLLLALFIFRGYRQKQKANVIITQQKEEVEKQKELIEEQKKIVEEKNKDITDSINYAQRIQRALLASDGLLNKCLTLTSPLPPSKGDTSPQGEGSFASDYFVFFKPKDIVSGDFYWATSVIASEAKQSHDEITSSLKAGTRNDEERFYLAVCDSTGHGVPGAFMSLLNISFLNEAITEKGIVAPNEILNHVRQRLIENISQDGRQDGMDGILISLKSKVIPIAIGSQKENSPNNTNIEIEYAAAHNAPILVRNGELIELEADKMPVGLGDKKESFSHYTIALSPPPSGAAGR